MSELVQNTARRATGAETNRDLLSALAGTQAGLDRSVAYRTRRVVMASAGVMRDQKAVRKRSRAVAVASILVMVLALGPFFWHVADDLIGGEHIADIATQTGLWVCLFCPALLAAALIAGWRRK